MVCENGLVKHCNKNNSRYCDNRSCHCTNIEAIIPRGLIRFILILQSIECRLPISYRAVLVSNYLLLNLYLRFSLFKNTIIRGFCDVHLDDVFELGDEKSFPIYVIPSKSTKIALDLPEAENHEIKKEDQIPFEDLEVNPNLYAALRKLEKQVSRVESMISSDVNRFNSKELVQIAGTLKRVYGLRRRNTSILKLLNSDIRNVLKTYDGNSSKE